jgi:hypothetical protein
MKVSGPTPCEQTYGVNTMLQNINKISKQTSERIIQLNKQQSIYDKI